VSGERALGPDDGLCAALQHDLPPLLANPTADTTTPTPNPPKPNQTKPNQTKLNQPKPNHTKLNETQTRFYGAKDDLERFMFFSRAALEWLVVSGKQPDIIHLHDWQSAAVVRRCGLGMGALGV